MVLNKPNDWTSIEAERGRVPIQSQRFQDAFLLILRQVFTTPPGWWLICICFAAVAIFSARHQITTDGLSYLDIGSAVSRGHLSALGNPYWSPAYPAMIGAAFFILRPSADNEVPVIQFVNFIIFVVTLWGFTLFFRKWMSSMPESEQEHGASKGIFTLFAFASFLWFADAQIIIPFSTPDLLAAALVFFVAAMGYYVADSGAGWKQFAGLGALLGMGIYVKAALFPLAFAFIVLRFLSLARGSELPRRKQLAHFAITTGLCIVVSAPLIISMSKQAGKFTTGEAGKLNYLWHVDGLQPDHVGWTGGTAPEFGRPLHPPRILMENPTVLEFATSTEETYPLWYNPGYWYAGAKPVFKLGKQITAARENLAVYTSMATQSPEYIVGAIVLFVLGMRKNNRAQPWRISFWLLAWPLAGCAMYAIVRVHPRYVAPFALILCLEIYRILGFRVKKRAAVVVCAIVALIPMTFLALHAARDIVTSARLIRHPVEEDYVVAAHKLQQMGLQPGDKVAVFGFAVNCFYARYDRLRVVAQILDLDDYLRLSPAEASRVRDRLASIGVKAIIAAGTSTQTEQPGWTSLGAFRGESLSVILLNAPGDASNSEHSGIHWPADQMDKHAKAETRPSGGE
jgi:hypothetical protein